MSPGLSRMPTRWWIAILLCAAITISYFDRQTLSIAVGEIRKQIPIPDETFAHLNTAFLLTYGLMYVVGGRLIDALGTRLGFFLIMVWWSLACASHGLATGFGMLAASRLMLGVGEGGGFPAATKAVAEWFPMRERATAMGIINGGTAIGGIVAPPAIAAILTFASWPWVFYISGAIPGCPRPSGRHSVRCRRRAGRRGRASPGYACSATGRSGA
jgi:ACS family hexuronate transporter-like MFS transporter